MLCVAQHLCNISIEGAAFLFFTDNEVQYPAGPHFSEVFYTTWVGVVSAVFSLIGITLYNRSTHSKCNES